MEYAVTVAAPSQQEYVAPAFVHRPFELHRNLEFDFLK